MDQSVGEDDSSTSSEEDGDGEIWQGDEDEEVERPTKALCMYAAYTFVLLQISKSISELNANTIIIFWLLQTL